MEINMVLLSTDWTWSKFQIGPADGRRSRSNLAFAVLAVIALSGLAVLSVANTMRDALFLVRWVSRAEVGWIAKQMADALAKW
jgi:hypothetical protein